MSNGRDLLEFWLQAGEERWMKSDPDFDSEIRDRFGDLVGACATGACDDWIETPEGALALVIALDQFPRNLFRGQAQAFASDAKAREVAAEAIARGYDGLVDPRLRIFFYMPFEHSESLADQDFCMTLCHVCGEGYLKWARLHRDVIKRFGRFPHRNGALGRHTSPAEQRFLDGGGFSAGTHKADRDQ